MPAAAPKPVLTKAPAPFESPGKHAAIISLLLVVITLAVYNPAVSHPFVNYDDDRYVTANTHVRAGLTGESIRWALTSTEQANWHPLTWISHEFDSQMFHLNPAGHHFTSVLIHSANVALLFLLLLWATGQIAPSAVVALLFALHPVNVESVAWIAERKNLLCTFFFFLALAAYGRYARKPSLSRYLAVAALFACGLASKPMVITLPFVLLLWDYWPLRRVSGWTVPASTGALPQKPALVLVIEKLPLLAMSAASAAITLIAQHSGGAMRSTQQFSFPVRLENAVHAYAMYLWNAVWPAKLAPLYPHPGDSLTAAQIVFPALLLIAITIAVFRFRNRGYLLVGWLWFLGTLVPVIGVVQVGDQAMADRYAYIPLIGIFVMAAFGVSEWVGSSKSEIQFKAVAGVVALCLLVLLGVATRRQLGYWQSSETLWQHALAVTDRNFIAHDNLGGALLQQGRIDEAMPHFYAAEEINPRDPMSHGNIGAYLVEQKRFPAAIAELHQVIELTSDRGLLSGAYANLGTAYRLSGDTVNARRSYEHSLDLNPEQANAWLGMGMLLEQQGDLTPAALDYERAAELQPSPEAFFRLGQTLARLGRNPEARSAYENALKMQPDFSDAQRALDSLR